jgi:hypothetical protein
MQRMLELEGGVQLSLVASDSEPKVSSPCCVHRPTRPLHQTKVTALFFFYFHSLAIYY